MNKIKRLQKQLATGKIDEQQYLAALADLLEDEDITQEEYDEALDYEVEEDGDGGKAIYTQADVDGFVLKKARLLVKKALRDADVDLTDVKPQDYLAKVTELASANKDNQTATDTELAELRKKAKTLEALEPKVKSLELANGVMRAANKYNPVNPTQVLRALSADYSDLLEYDDETGELDQKSVEKALQRIAKLEPNLFKDSTDDPEELDEDYGDEEPGFAGKPPVKTGGTDGSKRKEQKSQEKAVSSALELMGLGKK